MATSSFHKEFRIKNRKEAKRFLKAMKYPIQLDVYNTEGKPITKDQLVILLNVNGKCPDKRNDLLNNKCTPRCPRYNWDCPHI